MQPCACLCLPQARRLILPVRLNASFSIFPVPPLQQLGIVLPGGRKIDDTAEFIEHAAVHMYLLKGTEPGIELFRVLTAQLFQRPEAQVPQILGNAFPHAGNSPQFLQHRLLFELRHYLPFPLTGLPEIAGIGGDTLQTLACSPMKILVAQRNDAPIRAMPYSAA